MRYIYRYMLSQKIVNIGIAEIHFVFNILYIYQIYLI